MSEKLKETLGTEKPRPIKALNEVERAEMLSRILSYRTAGIEWSKICETVSKEFKTELKMTSAHRLYNNYIDSLPKDALDTARLLALHRLDSIISKAFGAFQKKGNVQALAVALQANKQISELLDIEAPKRVDVNHSDERAENVRRKLFALADAREHQATLPPIN